MNTIMFIFNILYIIAMSTIAVFSIRSWRKGEKYRKQFRENILELHAKYEQKLHDEIVMADMTTQLEVRLQEMEKRIMEELKNS